MFYTQNIFLKSIYVAACTYDFFLLVEHYLAIEIYHSLCYLWIFWSECFSWHIDFYKHVNSFLFSQCLEVEFMGFRIDVHFILWETRSFSFSLGCNMEKIVRRYLLCSIIQCWGVCMCIHCICLSSNTVAWQSVVQ